MLKKTLLTFVLLLFATGPIAAEAQKESAASSKTRIGVYDSRAVAIAYGASPHHRDWLKNLHAARDKAEAAGNSHWAKRLDAVGEASEKILHEQAVTTAPVNDLLALIIEKLPEITKEAGVVTLISKWDEDSLSGYPDAERVDITMRLVDAFDPDEKARASAGEILDKEPVPLSSLDHEAPGIE